MSLHTKYNSQVYRKTIAARSMLRSTRRTARNKKLPSRRSRRPPGRRRKKRFVSEVPRILCFITCTYVSPWTQLDPANNKTVIDIQNESLAAHADEEKHTKNKGKRKAAALEEEDDSDDAMHLDAPISDSDDGSDDEQDDGGDADADGGMGVNKPPVPMPMPESGGIQALREKLHARMAELRQRGRGRSGAGGSWEAGSRDELLEERRQQRAAMRERRRKETKEKIRREEERKGKGKDKGKEKEKEKQQQVKGPQTKVRPWCIFLDYVCTVGLNGTLHRPNC